MKKRIEPIETNRLFLREFKESDARSFFELNSYPEVLKFTGDKPFQSIKESREFLLNYKHYEKYGFGRWAVIDKNTNNFMGWCGLKYNEEKLVDLGFRLLPKYWNKGYATEAAKKCLELAFEFYKLTEVIGRAAQNNKPSHRVLEKLGFHAYKTGSCDGIPNAIYFKIERASFLV